MLLCNLCMSTAFAERCQYIEYRGRKVQDDCSSSKICQKDFVISSIDFPPYATANLLESAIQKCCGKCANITYDKQYPNISAISISSLKKIDFILPFLAKSSAKSLYGFYFIPLVETPNVYYFTPKYRSVMENLILGCLRLYPLVIVSLLMAVIAGFIFWLCETWYDRSQFPRSFLSGTFEGFWYSFVSMTTVGYGDRTVTSPLARIIAVIWILIGIVMFSLILSTFTAEIFEATEIKDHPIEGMNVGALRYRGYDASVIVEHGGIVKESNSWNFFSDALALIRMLRRGDIDGFILDRYTLTFVMGYLEWKKKAVDYNVNRSRGETYEERQVDINFFTNQTYRSIKTPKTERMSYGVLVKDINDYEYFRHAIEDNQLTMEISIASAMNKMFVPTENPDIFSSSGVYYQETLKIISGILGTVFLFGLIYDARNTYQIYKKKRNQENAK